MTIVSKKPMEFKILDKKEVYKHIKDKETHYLIFRKFEDNYYLASGSYKLPNNKTPADSLVCEVSETWDKVCKDKLAFHILPSKLPNYIIDGFKQRLEHEIKSMLFLEFKELEPRFGHCKLTWVVATKEEAEKNEVWKTFFEAQKKLLEILEDYNSIEDFFKLSISLQTNGAIKTYLLDLVDKK